MQHAKNCTMPDESQHDSCFRTMYIIHMHFKKLFTKRERYHSCVIFSHTIIIFKKNFFLNIHFFQIYKETSKVFVIFRYHYGILSLIFLILIYICFIIYWNFYGFILKPVVYRQKYKILVQKHLSLYLIYIFLFYR